MAEGARAASGSIYDLGYRPYEGARLGRPYAILSLYVYSLRAVFGLGRSAMSKVFPFGLAILALIPAVVQLGVAALVPVDVKLIRPENYFGYTQIIVVLFCAVAAPEIVGRDQRTHTLPLYFSRALARADYVSAKLAALTVALFLVTVTPQAVLFLGGAVAASDILKYTGDNLDLVAPIVLSSLVISVFMASVSLAIGSQTPRRAIATTAVLASFVILSAIGGILVQTTTGDIQKYAVLLSPIDVTEGAVRWLFGAAPQAGSSLAKSGLGGWACFAAVCAYTAASLAVLYRRFARLAV